MDVLAELFGQLVIRIIIATVSYIFNTVYNAFKTIIDIFQRLIENRSKNKKKKKNKYKEQTEKREQIEQKEDQDEPPQQQSKQQQKNKEEKHEKVEEETKTEPKSSKIVPTKGNSTFFGWVLFLTVPQGFLGITKTLGVLSPKLLSPGVHFVIPSIQQSFYVPISVQTSTVYDVPCGSQTGVMLSFDKIEVVSQLKTAYLYETVKNYSLSYNKYFIIDKIPHKINKFCSKYTVSQIAIEQFDKMDQYLVEELRRDNQIWAPGIEIISVRLTKPKIPQAIRKNYEEMEMVKVDFMVTIERQKVLIEKEQTKLRQQQMRAQTDLQVKLIDLQKEITLKQNELKMQVIEAQIQLQRMNTQTDNEYLIHQKAVEANKYILSHSFLVNVGRNCLNNNITFKLGEKIPKVQL